MLTFKSPLTELGETVDKQGFEDEQIEGGKTVETLIAETGTTDSVDTHSENGKVWMPSLNKFVDLDCNVDVSIGDQPSGNTPEFLTELIELLNKNKKIITDLIHVICLKGKDIKLKDVQMGKTLHLIGKVADLVGSYDLPLSDLEKFIKNPLVKTMLGEFLLSISTPEENKSIEEALSSFKDLEDFMGSFLSGNTESKELESPSPITTESPKNATPVIDRLLGIDKTEVATGNVSDRKVSTAIIDNLMINFKQKYGIKEKDDVAS